MNISVTSLLGREYQDDLEQLFFFNPKQGSLRREIVESVKRFGNPRLVERLGGLRIELPGAPEAQTLYALAGAPAATELVGVVVFNRNSSGEFEVLHIAVKSEFTSKGIPEDQAVSFQLVAELCRVARRVKGVRTVRLPYGRGRVVAKHLTAT